VETALAAESLLARREDALAQAAEQSREAQRLAEERYGSGLESFVTVLESQRRSLQADGELIAVRRLRLENRVDLHLALGGGFEPLEPYYERTKESPSEMTEELS
jgi:outer membrane protein TolC